MKALIRLVLFFLCPVLCLAEVAGTWEGVLKFPAQTLRIVLHISGDDNALKATNDSPDQDVWGSKVDSIALAERVLTFAIPRIDVRFSGDLMPDGTIVGTFKQHGTGLPLTLARSAGVPRILPDTTSNVTDGRYHNDFTGIEFNVPEKFTFIETENRSNPGGLQADFALAGVTNGRLGVWMNKQRMRPENIPASLNVSDSGEDSATRRSRGELYDSAEYHSEIADWRTTGDPGNGVLWGAREEDGGTACLDQHRT